MNIFLKLFSALRGVSLSEPNQYSEIRNVYKYEIQDAILRYLIDETKSVAKYSNAMQRAMADAFGYAFDRGYIDGGGDIKEMTSDDHSWLASKQETEIGFIKQLFERLKEMKKESKEEDQSQSEYLADIEAEVDARVNGYANTLDGIYAEGRLRGSNNIMLTFDGDDGQESCLECRKWKGKRHSASFWIKRGLIPGQPGNQNFSCRGYNCKHYLYDDKGEIWAGH